jgi:histone H3/H4
MEGSMSDKEILVVVSKLKAYIKSSADMNTAGNVAPRLSDIVRGLCDEAVQRAKADGRKTVMDRDF